jgi:hypothetical protein
MRTWSRIAARTDGGNTKRWVVAWVGASVLGVANGVGREAVYADAVGDDAAHVISTGTLLSLLAGYVWLLQRRWPLADRREALSVGAAWAAMTVAFEFGFGHWVDGDSWSALLENYDVTAGRVWVLVPAAMAAGPELARRMAARERDDRRATLGLQS